MPSRISRYEGLGLEDLQQNLAEKQKQSFDEVWSLMQADELEMYWRVAIRYACTRRRRRTRWAGDSLALCSTQ
jgi:hypothetical protein